MKKHFYILRKSELIVSVFAIFLASIACSFSGKNTQNPSNPPAQAVTEESVQSNPSAQSGFTPAPSLPESVPIESTIFPFKIVPYNYSLVDAENGWKKGEVYLAFENATNTNIDLSIAHQFQYQSSKYEWIIETAEGVTYPAQLYQWGMGVPEIELPFEGVIPLGFRFTKYEKFYENILLWQSASAATPTKATVKDHPEISFNFPQQNQTIPFPFEAPPSNLISISSWANKELYNQPNEIQINFTGQCGNLFYFRPDYNNSMDNLELVRTLYLEVQVTNHDKFNQHTADLSIPYMIFERDGFIKWYQEEYYITELPNEDGQFGSIVVGPDQNKTGYLRLIENDYAKKDEPLPIIMIWNGQEYQVFDAASCNFSPLPAQ